MGAAELGTAAATTGLIPASVLGGPIAKFFIDRNDLVPGAPAQDHVPTAAAPSLEDEDGDPDKIQDDISQDLIMRSILWIHVAFSIGWLAWVTLEEAGMKLPLFVPCLISAILLANLLPAIWPKRKWYARSKATDLISEFSLSVFLSMSLMSMQLWALASSANVLAVTMLSDTS